MLGQTWFVGSEFGIFGGLGWVYSSILVDESGFGRVRSSVFPDFDLGLSRFLPDRFLKFPSFLKEFKWVRSSVLVDE